jgi:hypothetical protein
MGVIRRTTVSAIALGTLLPPCGCAHLEPLSNAYSNVAAPVGDRCSFGAARQDGTCDIYDVSLVELLAVPERFHDKRVRVIGFVTLRFEGNALCAGERSGTGCLWLDLEGVKDPGFRKGWAEIEGRFDGEGRGHMGCCAGAIDEISRLARWHY